MSEPVCRSNALTWKCKACGTTIPYSYLTMCSSCMANAVRPDPVRVTANQITAAEAWYRERMLGGAGLEEVKP